MNFAYIRRSSRSRIETVTALKKAAQEQGMNVLGDTELPSESGNIIHLCSADWMAKILSSDPNLIGLLPCSVVVFGKEGQIRVGVGSPAVLGGVSRDPEVIGLAGRVEEKLRRIVEQGAGVGPLKIESVKLYSTTTCPYCKLEASWLDGKKIPYEEVHVDMNQQEADEMVKKTGQMGVPVTAIRYEDAGEEYIVGFDKPQLAQILGVSV